MFEAAEIYKN